MTIEIAQEPQLVTTAAEWEPPMPPTDLIFDDGEPLESNRHRIAMNLLIRSLLQQWQHRNDFFTGGNMFIYFSSTQARNQDFRGPDFFVVTDTDGTKSRQGWVVWEEDGRYPDIIVELLSATTAVIDKGKKKNIYERVFRTPDYFIFDPFEPNSLQGWHLNGAQRYQPIEPNERGWLWSSTLDLWLGTWSGTIDRETAVWLRFYDRDGNLVLLPDEAERLRAEWAQQQVLQEQQRAEAERLRAELAQQQVLQEQQRAERLAARLREMGVDPDSF